MMKANFTKSRAIIFSFLVISFLGPGITKADADSLVVHFERTPLFSEVNFIPGNETIRWVKVENNSPQSQNIIIEAINKTDASNLASQLGLTIKESGTVLYEKTLEDFFNAGEILLSGLAGGGTETQYDFIIRFKNQSGNNYQGKALSFDILIGFQGKEGGIASNGESGVVLPFGLTIAEESVQVVDFSQTTATIAWTTSYQSTSQVIYAKKDGFEEHILDLSDNTESPPKYGYERTSPEYDVNPKVTYHLITIYGLESGSEYYFRTVSHGSLAVGKERVFTTLAKQHISTTDGQVQAGKSAEATFSPLVSEGEVSAGIGQGKTVNSSEEASNLLTGTERDFRFAANVLLFFSGNNKWFLYIGLILFILLFLWIQKRRRAGNGSEKN